MKLFITPFVVFLTILVTAPQAFSQPDTLKIKEKAVVFADSLVKSDYYKSWSAYADLTPLSVLKHYGGKDGFIQHIQGGRPRTVSAHEDEAAPEITVLSLLPKDDQWQCVTRVSRYIHRDEKKYHLVTYFLCQSKDDGETWRLFDLSYNKVANVIYMLPDVNTDLAIPEPYIISEEEELAKQKATEDAAAATAASKRKPTPKKN